MNEWKSELVIFGTGKIGKQIGGSLDELGISYCYTDNNSQMWGGSIHSKRVINPAELLEQEYTIIVAITDSIEVEKQLLEMGTCQSRIISLHQARQMICNCIVEREKEDFSTNCNEYTTTYTDHFFRNAWGGMEKWAYVVSEEMIKEIKGRVVLLTNEEHCSYLEKLSKYTYVEHISLSHNWIMVIKGLIKKIMEEIPCTIVCNSIAEVYYAAYCVKRLYPNQVRIIVVQHNNRELTIRSVCENIEYIDSIVAVSKDICRTLYNTYGVPKNKLHYKESFVKCEELLERTYSTSEKPIKICFVSRIEIIHKRCDLLIPIIQLLEEKGCNYELNIAGVGKFLKELEIFINNNKLGSKVFCLGFLQNEEVNNLLREQDIFLQCSECEGSSLSLLEAMAYGVVPVVTRAGTAEDFIENGQSGYICEVNDVEALCEAIIMLEQNRKLLPTFAEIGRNRVIECCNLKDYSKYMKCVIENQGLEMYRGWSED